MIPQPTGDFGRAQGTTRIAPEKVLQLQQALGFGQAIGENHGHLPCKTAGQISKATNEPLGAFQLPSR